MFVQCFNSMQKYQIYCERLQVVYQFTYNACFEYIISRETQFKRLFKMFISIMFSRSSWKTLHLNILHPSVAPRCSPHHSACPSLAPLPSRTSGRAPKTETRRSSRRRHSSRPIRRSRRRRIGCVPSRRRPSSRRRRWSARRGSARRPATPRPSRAPRRSALLRCIHARRLA